MGSREGERGVSVRGRESWPVQPKGSNAFSRPFRWTIKAAASPFCPSLRPGRRCGPDGRSTAPLRPHNSVHRGLPQERCQQRKAREHPKTSSEVQVPGRAVPAACLTLLAPCSGKPSADPGTSRAGFAAPVPGPTPPAEIRVRARSFRRPTALRTCSGAAAESWATARTYPTSTSALTRRTRALTPGFPPSSGSGERRSAWQ